MEMERPNPRANPSLEELMRRTLLSLLLLTAALPIAAEEISLKDGTKIVGHMTAVSGDKIEVETAYGKMQLKRSDILTIIFPENGASPISTAAPAASVKKDAPPVIEDSLRGTQYVNKTGKFTLTVPEDWKVNSNLVRSPVTVAGLSSKDEMRFLLVAQEQYTGSLESYEGIGEIQVRKTLTNYEKIMESTVTIDGKPALLISYRGVTTINNLPVQFLLAIIPSGTTFTRVTTWCVEPLFHEMQPTFEKILNSYHSTGPAAVSVSSRP